MEKNYIDYWFEDEETGEQFLVELESTADSTEFWDIAYENFEAPCLLDIITDDEAEVLGYDTY